MPRPWAVASSRLRRAGLELMACRGPHAPDRARRRSHPQPEEGSTSSFARARSSRSPASPAPASAASRSTRCTPRGSGASSRASARTRGSSSSGSSGRRWTALEPVPAGIAVDRRAPVKSSRSTVATMADLEPYLAALFAREAVPVCPERGARAVALDPDRRGRARCVGARRRAGA